MRLKPSIGEYLAFLSVKYEVDPEEFLHALRTAQVRKSNCGNLSIECRGRKKTKLIFLIMKVSEVIAQFPMDKEFLLNRNNQLGNFMGTERVRNYLSRKKSMFSAHSIKDVRAGMKNVNLQAKILEVAEPKRVFTRCGNPASFAKVLVGDETGTIKLCLWNGQINGVSEGETIQIKNAQAACFRGEQFLKLGKKGTLNKDAPNPPFQSTKLLNAKT
jgi:replication factor A1